MKKEFLKISVKNRKFKAGLHAMGFMDGDSHIIYIPSLQLSAYGDSFEEAHEMMYEVLAVFSEDMFECSETEVDTILSDLGWKKQKYFPKKRINLSNTTFEDIKKQFNLPEIVQGREFDFAV